jgi:streptomycin 6-kinase
LIQLPEPFIQTVIGVHQEKGALWLKQFNELIQYCEEKWSLRVISPYSLSYNYVASVILQDGQAAVLKLGVPSKEINTEIEALTLYGGKGMAHLLASDADKGILLLEQVSPGQTLKSVANDEEATLIAAEVMRKFRVPAPQNAGFPTLAQWAKGLERLRIYYNEATGPIPERLVSKAESLFTQLIPSITNPLLLHGDLHHENILSAARDPWLAIDPKGLIGEAEYEVIPFLLNHLPENGCLEITKRRVELFVQELQLNEERVLAWAFSHSILSAWWHVEDHSSCVEHAIQMALLFEQLMK